MCGLASMPLNAEFIYAAHMILNLCKLLKGLSTLSSQCDASFVEVYQVLVTEQANAALIVGFQNSV